VSGRFRLNIRKNFFQDRVVNTGTCCPGKWWSHCPCRYLKNVWMWCLGAWFSGGFGSVRLTVGLHHLKGPFQPKLFYDSMEGESYSSA